MPKKETSEIQKYLVELGTKLGFISRSEEKIKYIDNFEVQSSNNNYSPIYDVVWYLNSEQYGLECLYNLVQDKQKNYFKENIPFAVFEIEGSTTTSKNQLGNFLNLSLSNSFLNFVIVNNNKASNENDTYRRGVKICRTYMEFSGYNNFIFLDWAYLKNIHKEINFSNLIDEKEHINNKLERSKIGGENDSDIMNNLIKLLEKLNLNIHQNYTPPAINWHYCLKNKLKQINTSTNDFLLLKKFVFDPNTNEIKKTRGKSSIYYCPQIDFGLTIPIPNNFKQFLIALSNNLNEQVFYYPILSYLKENPNLDIEFPFIGIEVESNVNKHLNGGVFNMSKFFHLGILISDIKGLDHLNTLKKIGINNILAVNEKLLLV